VFTDLERGEARVSILAALEGGPATLVL